MEGDDEVTVDTGEDFIVHESDGIEPSSSEGSLEKPDADEGKGDEGKGDAGKGDADDAKGASDDDDGDDDGSNKDASAEEKGDDAGAGDGGGDDGKGSGKADAADGAGDAEEEEDDEKQKRSSRDRINQITKKWRSEQRAGEGKDARIAELEKKLTAKGDDVKDADDNSGEEKDSKPDPSEFTYGEADPEYVAALTKYLVDEGVAKIRADDKATRQEEAAGEEALELQTQYDEKITEGVEAYDDFQEVVVDAADEGKYPLSRDFAILAVGSPVGHHVMYQIATDLPLAKKIAQMTPVLQAREFGRLEAQHSPKGAPEPKKSNKITKAPTPPKKRTGGTGAKKFNAVEASFEEFEENWRAEEGKQPKRW